MTNPPDHTETPPAPAGGETRHGLDRVAALLESHGELKPGKGLIVGVIAFALAALSFLGVLAFRFPAYLTTPEVRQVYDVTTLRYVMFGAMVLSGAASIVLLLLGRVRALAATTFAVLVVTELLGGPTVPVGDFPDDTPYLGLDWFILDLLGSALIFIVIEKLFALRKDQPVFRTEWQVDFYHFLVNHLTVGFVLLAVNRVVHEVFGWAAQGSVRHFVQGLPYLVQLFLVVLVADLMQYWTHRAYHEVPFLWRFHSVHHSAKAMDWLAGSRQHILELIVTRIAVLAPIFVLGFSKGVVDAYVVIVGFQAVFNHANVSARMGPLRFVIVTPNFHHWHHSRDTEAIDKNYSAHFAFLDYLFGTAVTADRKWPERYGVVGDYVPPSWWKQVLFPFVGSTKNRE